jgi:hypothetical protein
MPDRLSVEIRNPETLAKGIPIETTQQYDIEISNTRNIYQALVEIKSLKSFCSFPPKMPHRVAQKIKRLKKIKKC